VKDELGRALEAQVERAVLLAGGASKEAWAVDTEDGRELLVRRAGGGVIHEGTLSLRDEFEVLRVARETEVLVPEPISYLGELAGREAFAMARVRGETIGRRIVQRPELAAAREALPLQMAEQLARIHAIPGERVSMLVDDDPIERFYRELDLVAEPHPAIELGLRWVRERLPHGREHVVVHGDFRLGNLAVDQDGLVAILDWEFAHVGDPAEDVAWPLVRSWRFGVDAKRLAGIADVEPYLARYCDLTGRDIPLAELDVWEVFGNVKWAIGALRQSRRHLSGEQRSVELAILGRLAAEMEYELLDLIDRHARKAREEGQTPDLSEEAPAGPTKREHALESSPSSGHGPGSDPLSTVSTGDRPTAGELTEAVREFLETEILPTLDDHRLRFRTLVAMNALGIVERDSPDPTEPDWELARRIRAGEPPEDVLPLVKEQVRRKLLVVNPSYLERF
jgi:aminoglycoside phosphotransferase (APT) family kinase protein